MKFFILARWLTYADAVSNDVLGLARVLEKNGFDVEVVCQEYHSRLKLLKRPLRNSTCVEDCCVIPVLNALRTCVRSASALRDSLHSSRPSELCNGLLGIKKLKDFDYSKVQEKDVVIYHLTSGWREGLDFLRRLKCRKILRYHNITPAYFYKGVSDLHEQRCLQGYSELPLYEQIEFDYIAATSQYTLQSLHEEGFKKLNGVVIPPFHHTEVLKRTPRHEKLYRKFNDNRLLPKLYFDEEWLRYSDARSSHILHICSNSALRCALPFSPQSEFRKKSNGINILSVGRISPNKGHLELLEAFAHYYYTYNRGARLILFGKRNWKLRKYTKAIKQKIKALKLKSCVYWINGGDLSKLRTCYETADLLVSLSKHEGFCVPIVEAMAFRVPILAGNVTALPETVGDGGHLVDNSTLMDDASSTVGSKIYEILSNKGVTADHVERGALRYQNYFTPNAIEKQWINLIRSIQRLNKQ